MNFVVGRRVAIPVDSRKTGPNLVLLLPRPWRRIIVCVCSSLLRGGMVRGGGYEGGIMRKDGRTDCEAFGGDTLFISVACKHPPEAL